jgi:hypothetical protein
LDPVAEDVAVLNDDITLVNTHPEVDASVRRHPSVSRVMGPTYPTKKSSRCTPSWAASRAPPRQRKAGWQALRAREGRGASFDDLVGAGED